MLMTSTCFFHLPPLHYFGFVNLVLEFHTSSLARESVAPLWLSSDPPLELGGKHVILQIKIIKLVRIRVYYFNPY